MAAGDAEAARMEAGGPEMLLGARPVAKSGSVDTRWRAVGLFVSTVILSAYPPAYAALRAGDRGVSAFVGGDALLYLTIARNSTGTFFTYDGTTPTNGFHPLWQYFLSALIPHTTPVGSMGPLWLAFWISLGAVALGSGFAALAIYRYTRSALLGFLTVPGVYYLVCGSLFSNLPIWASVSGMESGFSTLFGGLFLYLLARTGTGARATFDDLFAARSLRWLPMGLVLPFMILTRLDDVFLILGFLVVIFLLDDNRNRPMKVRLIAAAQLIGPSAVVVAAYMLFNRSYAGTFLPISGQSKAGLVLGKNLYVTLAGLFPPVIDIKNALSAKQSDPVSLFAAAFRWAELLVPALICGTYVAWYRVHRREGVRAGQFSALSPRYALPVGIAVGIILKATYNLSYVHLWHQASWYYAFAALAVSFLVAIPLGPAFERLMAEPVLRWAVPIAYGAYVLASGGRFIAWETERTLDNVEYDYIAERAAIAAELRAGRPEVKLLAFDDGTTGYALPFPTIQGFAFAADIQTHRALREGRLLRHAYARGHRILTSSVYLPLTKPLASSDDIRAFLKQNIPEPRVKDELDLVDFRLLYTNARTHAPFFEFAPRGLLSGPTDSFPSAPSTSP